MTNLIDLLPTTRPTTTLGNYTRCTLSDRNYIHPTHRQHDPLDPPPGTVTILRP